MNASDPSDDDVRPLLACLGVASRFRLVRALAGSDRCVGELAVAVGLSQSCTTRHLQALERLGLVKGRREGRRVRFRLSVEAPGLGGLIGLALSEEGRGGRVAGGDLHRDRVAPRPAGPVGAPDGDHRRPRTRSGPPPVKTMELVPEPTHAGAAEAGEDGSVGARRDPAPTPTPRRGDLEDYLL
jgi:DNA-binding transcriptional ArsR family regulator